MSALYAYLNLVIAHFISDFSLQTTFVAEWKSKSWYVMLVHVTVWTGVVTWMLHYHGRYSDWKPIFLFAGHWAMDAWKCKLVYKKLNLSDNQAFMIDQAWHAIQLVAVL